MLKILGAVLAAIILIYALKAGIKWYTYDPLHDDDPVVEAQAEKKDVVVKATNTTQPAAEQAQPANVTVPAPVVEHVPSAQPANGGNDGIVAAIQQGFSSASKEMNEKLDTLLGRTNKIDGKVDSLHAKIDGLDKRVARLEDCACKGGVRAKATSKAAPAKKPAAHRTTIAAPAPKPAPVVVAKVEPTPTAAPEAPYDRWKNWRTPSAPGLVSPDELLRAREQRYAETYQYQPAMVQTQTPSPTRKSKCGPSACR